MTNNQSFILFYLSLSSPFIPITRLLINIPPQKIIQPTQSSQTMIKKLVLLFLTIAFINYEAQASHLMGGEITWTCAGNGAFIFKVKLYRDCNGINAPQSVNLATNAPVSGGISCSYVSNNEISPIGPGCPTCLNPSGNASVVEEYIYESAPVVLNGVPPPTGWYFEYSDCCRNAAISNLITSGGQAFVLHATMFPFNGNNTFPCFDQSPVFSNSPSLALCTNDTVNYSHSAIDPELDSLHFSWAEPLSTYPSGFIPFSPGYSYLSPLPGTFQNPANLPALLDSNSGIMSFYSVTTGSFVTKTKVTAYKCGQKVAEIFRELQVTLLNCPIDSVTNNHAPFANPAADVISYFIIAGDSIEENFEFIDFELHPFTGSQQLITLQASGFHFGNNFSDTLNGCLIPPCATLLNPTPISGSPVLSNTLKWKTACAHAAFNNGCLQHNRRFDFLFKANDDFCPANGVRFKLYQINVTGPVIYTVGNSLAVSYPGVSLQWYLNGVPIPNATDTIITPVQGGIYTVIATGASGCQMISNPILRTFTGTPGIESGYGFALYPNPATAGDFINLQLRGTANEFVIIHIYDLHGRTVKSFEADTRFNNEMLRLESTGIAAGVYTIQIQTSKGIAEEKLVIR